MRIGLVQIDERWRAVSAGGTRDASGVFSGA